MIQILGRLDVHVRGRDEGIDADGDDETALDLGLDATGGDGALGELGEDVVPVLLLLGLVVGEDRIALLVFELLDQHLDGAADLELADVDKLVGGDDALGFAADIDDDLVLADFGDDTGDDLALLELAEAGLGQQLLHDGTHNVRGACSSSFRSRNAVEPLTPLARRGLKVADDIGPMGATRRHRPDQRKCREGSESPANAPPGKGKLQGFRRPRLPLPVLALNDALTARFAIIAPTPYRPPDVSPPRPPAPHVRLARPDFGDRALGPRRTGDPETHRRLARNRAGRVE